MTLITPKWKGAAQEAAFDGVSVVRTGGNASVHALALGRLSALKPTFVVDDLAHVVPWGTPLFRDVPGAAFFHHLHARTLGGQVPGPSAAALSWLEQSYPLVYRRWEFVTESTSSAQDLVGLGVPESRVIRIPPGVNRETFKPGQAASGLRLVYFGGFRRYKRPVDAILLARELRRRQIDFELFMVGNGPELEHVRAVTTSARLDGFVRFFGRLPDLELAQLVGSSWVNLHFAIAEGWALSVTEAAVCGVPTAAYDVPGLTDSIVNHRTGELVGVGDIPAMADAVCAMAEQRDSYSAEAERFGSGFTWDRTANSWGELIRSRAI